MEEINQVLSAFETEIADYKNRGRSWEMCYEFFRDKDGIKRKESDLDLASLYLAFYLASWGMYRGSSFLLQKSCLIFNPVIKKLTGGEYEELWNLDMASLDKNKIDIIWKKIEKLKNEVFDVLRPEAEEEARKRNKKTNQPTDTLITKILMGTMGCVPAYDEYLIKGIKKENICQIFNKKSFTGLVEFYKENRCQFGQVKFKTAKNNIPYPPMKNLDLYFWAKGEGK